MFEASKDPFTVNWQSGEQICISNTLFAAIFSLFTFSSACYVVVGIQILNYFEKEKKKQQESGDYKLKKSSASKKQAGKGKNEYSAIDGESGTAIEMVEGSVDKIIGDNDGGGALS